MVLTRFCGSGICAKRPNLRFENFDSPDGHVSFGHRVLRAHQHIKRTVPLRRVAEDRIDHTVYVENWNKASE